MSYPRVERSEGEIRLYLEKDQPRRYPAELLPPAFLQWQSGRRMEMFAQIVAEGAEAIRRQPAHLPVFATIGSGPFVVNLATRGMGPLPRGEHLAEATHWLETARRENEGRPAGETLAGRVEAAKAVYSDPERLDPRLLGGLEIFEGRTRANLERLPLASLLYADAAPGYLSYQLNGVVQQVDAPDPYYRFLLAARELFAFDAFHIHQSRYPHGYVFHVSEVLDKTPFPRERDS